VLGRDSVQSQRVSWETGANLRDRQHPGSYLWRVGNARLPCRDFSELSSDRDISQPGQSEHLTVWQMP
jgi:hypothetical protein